MYRIGWCRTESTCFARAHVAYILDAIISIEAHQATPQPARAPRRAEQTATTAAARRHTGVTSISPVAHAPHVPPGKTTTPVLIHIVSSPVTVHRAHCCHRSQESRSPSAKNSNCGRHAAPY